MNLNYSYNVTILYEIVVTFTFSRRFYPKNLTIEEYHKRFVIKRQIETGSARNTKFKALLKSKY